MTSAFYLYWQEVKQKANGTIDPKFRILQDLTCTFQ